MDFIYFFCLLAFTAISSLEELEFGDTPPFFWYDFFMSLEDFVGFCRIRRIFLWGFDGKTWKGLNEVRLTSSSRRFSAEELKIKVLQVSFSCV